jgi:hypothetical protein
MSAIADCYKLVVERRKQLLQGPLPEAQLITPSPVEAPRRVPHPPPLAEPEPEAKRAKPLERIPELEAYIKSQIIELCWAHTREAVDVTVFYNWCKRLHPDYVALAKKVIKQAECCRKAYTRFNLTQ